VAANAGDFFRNRVFYCASGDYIGYDQDTLAGSVYEIGDFAVSVLLANAWSDAMQSRLGITIAGKDRSLQADCLTGGWTASTLPDRQTNTDGLVLSPGDLDEGITAFLQFSLEGDTNPDEVGTAFERIASFRHGVVDGIDACGI
jgi:predicted metalloprotease